MRQTGPLFSIDYVHLEKELQHLLSKPVNELYLHWNESHDCYMGLRCFPTLKLCTLSFLNSFCILATTNVFQQIWRNNLSIFLASKIDSTQENIIDFVWKPTFKHCVELITRLKSGNILLSEVEKVFCDEKTLEDLQSSCESLTRSLIYCKEHSSYKLCTCGCCTAPEIQQRFTSDTSMISKESEWIVPACKSIEHFRLSLKCMECAETVLTLCDEDHLNLTGDFITIHALVEKVRTTMYNVLNLGLQN